MNDEDSPLNAGTKRRVRALVGSRTQALMASVQVDAWLAEAAAAGTLVETHPSCYALHWWPCCRWQVTCRTK